MITPETKNTDNSPWYSIMEERAIAWNEFAEQIGAEISGKYNAYKVEFKLKAHIENGEIDIYGVRALMNVGSKFIPRKGEFSEVLRIDYSSSKYEEKKYLKLYKKGLIKGIFNYFDSHYYKTTIEKYTVKYNDPINLDKVTNSGILKFNKLNKFEINEKGMFVEMFELPYSKTEIELIAKLMKMDYFDFE